MRVIGVELRGSDMFFVVVSKDDGDLTIVAADKITLGQDLRDQSSLAAFQVAVVGILGEHAPDLVAVKQKPERGQFAAGAAALKMEALLLATASCPVEFVSGHKAKGQNLDRFDVPKYQHPALASALVVLASST